MHSHINPKLKGLDPQGCTLGYREPGLKILKVVQVGPYFRGIFRGTFRGTTLGSSSLEPLINPNPKPTQAEKKKERKRAGRVQNDVGVKSMIPFGVPPKN